jgi:2-polyprenyl-3-methyl-5-hydroxy-6-metoxy-1,4-benzoquinol methylase
LLVDQRLRGRSRRVRSSKKVQFGLDSCRLVRLKTLTTYRSSRRFDKVCVKLAWFAAGPGPKDTVLDVACGPGLVVCAFAPYAGRVTGIDMTPATLDRARRFAAKQGVAQRQLALGRRILTAVCR